MKIEDTQADRLTNVRFRLQPILNEDASKKASRPIYDEIEVCEFSFPANKQTVGVFPAHETYGWQEEDNGYGAIRMPITYAMRYNAQYMAFKNGDIAAVSGTPLEELPFLSQGKRMELKALKIHTAETLAALDGTPLKQLGQGGRDLKNKAQAYLDVAAKTSDTSNMRDELAKRDAELSDMKKQIEELQAAPRKPGRPSKASKFDTFENADIANWINDADPESKMTEEMPRDELMAKADAILAQQGKQKTVAQE